MSKLTKEAAEFIRTMKRTAARTKPERLVEAAYGRELEDFETVLYKDGDRNNLKPENLLIGLKAGVDWRLFTCRYCGNRVMGLTDLHEVERSPDQ